MKCSNSKCDRDANPLLGSGKFCSRSCANSRVRSEETKKKIGEGVKRTGIIREPLSGDSLLKWKTSIKKTYAARYASKSFDDLSVGQKRRRVLEEQNHACADCGITEWKSLPITLEMDHKDGNTENNSRDNLWALCPNCHSVTDTWRGRNKVKINMVKEVSNDVLLHALQTEPSIRQALLKVGLSARGNNYQRAKSLLDNSVTVM